MLKPGSTDFKDNVALSRTLLTGQRGESTARSSCGRSAFANYRGRDTNLSGGFNKWN